MSGKNNNATAEAAVALQSTYDSALAVLTAFPETATAEEKAEAQTAIDSAKKAPVKETVVKIKFLMSPTGKYNLAYGPGEKASFPKLQAEELIEAGYAELVK